MWVDHLGDISSSPWITVSIYISKEQPQRHRVKHAEVKQTSERSYRHDEREKEEQLSRCQR